MKIRFAFLLSILLLALAAYPRQQIGGLSRIGGAASIGGGNVTASAPSFVSGSTGTCTGNNVTVTIEACTTALAGTLNDWIVVIGGGSAAGTLSITVSGCTVGSWISQVAVNDSNFFWGQITSGGACTPSLNTTGAAQDLTLQAGEVTGSTGTNGSCSPNCGITVTTFGAGTTCSAITTTLANTLVIAGLEDSGLNSKSWTATGPFSLLGTQPSGYGQAIISNTETASGSYTPAATYGQSATLNCGVVAFHP